MKLLTLSSLASIAAAAPTLEARQSNQTTDYGNLTVALVRAPPANWPEPFWNKNWTGVQFDIAATVEKAVGYIEDAASSGANLVSFPELWFPGYPKGIDADWIANHAEDYYNNSIQVGDEHWTTLLSAAKANHVFLAMGLSEKTNQSIYMAQAFISPYGELLHLRHKLRPSGIERYLWSDGTADGLKVLDTPYGRLGLLECWEHFHPSMTFNMQAQAENIHVAAYPYNPDYNDSNALYWETLEVNGAATRLYAVNSGAITLMTSIGYSAVLSGEGLVTAEVKASVPYDEQPMLYASINTTAFSNVSYNVDGEQSWGILQQIEDSWPYYVPKVEGTYVKQKTILMSDIEAYSAAYLSSNGTTNATLP